VHGRATRQRGRRLLFKIYFCHLLALASVHEPIMTSIVCMPAHRPRAMSFRITTASALATRPRPQPHITLQPRGAENISQMAHSLLVPRHQLDHRRSLPQIALPVPFCPPSPSADCPEKKSAAEAALSLSPPRVAVLSIAPIMTPGIDAPKKIKKRNRTKKDQNAPRRQPARMKSTTARNAAPKKINPPE
jgi:hypothetical protein